ncbi:MAG: hypothetical protein RQ856_01695 [Candidatus Izemoplasmatales bacterium]|nr:hypothetical protein [Candidatus Izemoplasmatales bacterium]
MKKLLGIFVLAFMALGITACAATPTAGTLSSEQSLASMAYLSSNFLSLNNDTTSNPLAFKLADETFEVEEELETVNEYLELLKAFMENGATEFAQLQEQASDRAEYTYMINITATEEVYVLYYNVDAETSEISGIFVINGEEYTIEAYNNLEDKEEFEDDDDDEDDEDEYDDEDGYEEDDNDEDDADDMSLTKMSDVTTTEEETTTTTEEEVTTDSTSGATVGESDDSEKKMVLIARNGDNYIEMTYKVETEGEETKTKFEMKTFINDVEKEIVVEIKIENNEYKVEVQDGENTYDFKREVENDGVKYELKYEVNGIEGEIQILETTNDLGETVYIYEIEEEGKYKEVEMEDEDDDDDEEDDVEEQAFLM